MVQQETILGLDIGLARVGVAVVRPGLSLVQALPTITYRPATFAADIAALATAERADRLVVGWPRGLDGQATDQTRLVEQLARQLKEQTGLPVELQDEALTSQRAESALRQQGQAFAKADIDSMAARFILDDYVISRHPELLSAAMVDGPAGADHV